MNWITSSRWRVTTARPVRQLLCFQAMPLSCSWRQTTFLLGVTEPSAAVFVVSKYYFCQSYCTYGRNVYTYLDVSKTITAQLKIVRTNTSTTISKIKSLLPLKWISRIRIRYCHLTDTQSVHHTSPIISHIMNRSTFSKVEPNSESPLLPLN